jgi:DNA adenine methylase
MLPENETPASGTNRDGQSQKTKLRQVYRGISRGATPEASEKDSLPGLSDSSREGGACVQRSHALKPLVKWVGGKTQLLEEILRELPSNADQLRYVEPFCGGAAVYWAVANQRCLLADTCAPLINFYRVVQSSPHALAEVLDRLPNNRNLYGFIRDDFNELIEVGDVRSAALFQWLNKSCFNGIWRTNRDGKFNVPAGSGVLSLPSWGELCDASQRMVGTDFLCMPFTWVLSDCGEGDLVYADPPYLPVKKGSFTEYAGPNSFTIDDHFELRNACELAAKRGAHVVVSNSDTPVMRDLWRNHRIRKVDARRSVNSKGTGRGAVGELIIRVEARP